MSALSDRMAGMTRKQAHELNDRVRSGAGSDHSVTLPG